MKGQMNIKHITLHEGTNKGPVIDLVLSIKSEINTLMTSLIVPQKDSLNNKAQEVNSLLKTCSEHCITFVDHTDTVDIIRHFNKSSVYNRPGTIEFAKNVCQILLKLDLR